MKRLMTSGREKTKFPFKRRRGGTQKITDRGNGLGKISKTN